MNAEQQLKIMGFDIIAKAKKNANGPDMWIRKGNKVLTVEIKKARKSPSGNYQSKPVEKNRQSDDLIAIEFPSGYVLIQSMKEHLINCGPKGYRSFGSIC